MALALSWPGLQHFREQDPEKAAEIEAWLALVAGAYNVLPMDAVAFMAWAKLMHRNQTRSAKTR